MKAAKNNFQEYELYMQKKLKRKRKKKRRLRRRETE